MGWVVKGSAETSNDGSIWWSHRFDHAFLLMPGSQSEKRVYLGTRQARLGWVLNRCGLSQTPTLRICQMPMAPELNKINISPVSSIYLDRDRLKLSRSLEFIGWGFVVPHWPIPVDLQFGSVKKARCGTQRHGHPMTRRCQYTSAHGALNLEDGAENLDSFRGLNR